MCALLEKEKQCAVKQVSLCCKIWKNLSRSVNGIYYGLWTVVPVLVYN